MCKCEAFGHHACAVHVCCVFFSWLCGVVNCVLLVVCAVFYMIVLLLCVVCSV